MVLMFMDSITFILLLAFAAPASALPCGHIPRLRPLDPESLQLLSAGIRQSPTLRQLATELGSSDVIVHIMTTRPRPRKSPAALQFVTSSGGFRFVRIRITTSVSRRRGIALLAHELQHAREVAGAASIVDEASFEAYYRRVGMVVDHDSVHRTYDTTAARQAEDVVFAELAVDAIGNAGTRLELREERSMQPRPTRR